MTLLLPPQPAAPDGDAEAVAALSDLLALQKKAFRADPYPALSVRREHLRALGAMVVIHRGRIREAMSADFAVHPDLLTDLVEVVGVAARAAYAADHLGAWCAPEESSAETTASGAGSATIRLHPKGVLGCIVPWSSPFAQSAGPLAEMLAAGNRVVLNPSATTPACAELLDDMVRATFDRDLVAVSVGGAELARTFPTLRWDHLLCTGSAATGREVAKAAADNLVPLTLQLGGTCPVLLTEDSVDTEAVRAVLGTKLVRSGQTRTSVDRVLVPRARVDRFVELAEQLLQEQVPGYASSPHCTGIVSERHLRRLTGLVEQARSAGVQVVVLGGPGDRGRRQLPLSLVVDPPAMLDVMTEHTCGPVLAVVPYDTLEQAVDHLNDGERPLVLSVFSKDAALAEEVLAATTFRSAWVNACGPVTAPAPLASGGSGRSVGLEGFREFSERRAVFVPRERNAPDPCLPPYGAAAQALVDAALGG